MSIMKGAGITTINVDPSPSARGKIIKKIRSDRTIVSEKGVLLSDCVLPSVSAAARFVLGKSVNGYSHWMVDDKTSLGGYLVEKGIRTVRKRTQIQ